jgi:hypothetical protein
MFAKSNFLSNQYFRVFFETTEVNAVWWRTDGDIELQFV